MSVADAASVAAASGSTDTSGAGTGGGSSSPIPGQPIAQFQGLDPKDPRDNRPVFRVNQAIDFTGPGDTNKLAGGINPFRAVGYMREDFGDGSIRTGGNFGLYFMFNPSEISIQYGFDPNMIAPDMWTADQAVAPSSITNMTYSFTLFFDRTMEVWQDNTHPGTLVDQRALERLMGMYDGISGQPYMARVRAFFSGVAMGGVLPGGKSLTLTGLISVADLTHTRFDKAMTPVHTTVQVSLMRIFNSADTNIANPNPAATSANQASMNNQNPSNAPRVRTIGRQVGT